MYLHSYKVDFFRAGVRQVHGNLSSRGNEVGSSQKISHWIGHDLYNYIICRDLAQNTFTHVRCGICISGREEMEEHLRTCGSDTQAEDRAPFYNIPGLPDCVYTFGWAFFCDGYWHMEVKTVLLLFLLHLSLFFSSTLP